MPAKQNNIFQVNQNLIKEETPSCSTDQKTLENNSFQ